MPASEAWLVYWGHQGCYFPQVKLNSQVERAECCWALQTRSHSCFSVSLLISVQCRGRTLRATFIRLQKRGDGEWGGEEVGGCRVPLESQGWRPFAGSKPNWFVCVCNWYLRGDIIVVITENFIAFIYLVVVVGCLGVCVCLGLHMPSCLMSAPDNWQILGIFFLPCGF